MAGDIHRSSDNYKASTPDRPIYSIDNTHVIFKIFQTYGNDLV